MPSPTHILTIPFADKQRAKSRKDLAAMLTVALCMLFVIGLSAFSLSHQSLRLDEAQSLWQSSHSPGGILYVVAQDVHVPLYAMLLHFWQFFFGNNVATARMLSLIFFVATIPAIFLLGQKAYSRNLGLFAAIMFAISPFLNWYGNETRMYSMLLFFTVMNQYFFVDLYKTKRPGSWWWYGLTALLGAFTHYFFGFILLCQAGFYLANRQYFSKHALRNFIIIAFLILVSLAPWAWYVLHLNRISNSSPLLIKPTTVDLFNTFSQFMFGFQNDHLNTLIVSLWPLAVLFGFLALNKDKKISLTTKYFLLTALAPVLAAFVISVFVHPLFVTRYLILTIPSLYLFLLWFVFSYPKALSFVLKAGLVAMMIFTLVIQATSAKTPVKEDYQQACSYLMQHATAQDVIAVSAPFTIYPIEYYYSGPAQLITLPIWNRYVTGAIPAFSESRLPGEVDQIKGDHEDIYLILSYNQGYEDKIKSYFDSHFQLISKQNFSQDLNVYEYKLRYDTASFQKAVDSLPAASSTPQLSP